MGIKIKNNAFGVLLTGITSTGTSITLQTGQGANFPSLVVGDYFYATLIDVSNNLEIVKVTARSSDILTVVRGQESTTARAYSAGDRLELRITALGLEEYITANGFPSGTIMLFQQTAAPTGWTKITTHDNKALRVVSGSAGSGGSVAFTTAFASQTPSGTLGGAAGATTLTTPQIPSHTHPYTLYSLSPKSPQPTSRVLGPSAGTWVASPLTSGATGGDGSHTHPVGTLAFTGSAIDLAVQYVDVIFASKA